MKRRDRLTDGRVTFYSGAMIDPTENISASRMRSIIQRHVATGRIPLRSAGPLKLHTVIILDDSGHRRTPSQRTRILATSPR